MDRKKLIIAGIIGLILIGIVAYFLFFRKSSVAQTPNPHTNPNINYTGNLNPPPAPTGPLSGG